MHTLSPETDNCPSCNQQKGENDHRKYFMIKLHKRMLLTRWGLSCILLITSQTCIQPNYPGWLNFRSEWFYPFWIYKLTKYFLPSFRVNGPFHSGEDVQNIFNMVAMATTLDSQSEPFFIYKLPLYFLPTFQSIYLGCRSCHLKQIADAHNGERWRTLTHHNSSPWALPAQLS